MIDGQDVAWAGSAPWAATVAECRREFVRVARSFWLIPEILPKIARDDVALLYCFCRRLDDAVDLGRSIARSRAGEARTAERVCYDRNSVWRRSPDDEGEALLG